jgi:hypothetical protein
MKMDRFAVAVLFLAVIFLLIPVISTAASPGEQSTKEPGIEGFRTLRWGTTEEEAKATYPDFVFERYALSDGGKEVPSRLYTREKEDRLLFGVSFERVHYWFRNARLWKVTAETRAILGPRTIQPAAETGFDQLAAELKTRFGKPAEEHFSGGFCIDRTMTWISGGIRITIASSAGSYDVDLLSFEISR